MTEEGESSTATLLTSSEGLQVAVDINGSVLAEQRHLDDGARGEPRDNDSGSNNQRHTTSMQTNNGGGTPTNTGEVVTAATTTKQNFSPIIPPPSSEQFLEQIILLGVIMIYYYLCDYRKVSIRYYASRGVFKVSSIPTLFTIPFNSSVVFAVSLLFLL